MYPLCHNRAHGRVIHVLQERFKAIVVVLRESHLLALARYAVLNPIRAGWVHPSGREFKNVHGVSDHS